MPHRKPVVLKIGGRALEPAGVAAAGAAVPGAGSTAREAATSGSATASAIGALATELATIGAPLVIVHGGGAEVSAWCGRLGVEPRFIDGLRVTDPPTLEVATAVLAGLANKRLVARLRAADLDAVGLAALDGGTVEGRAAPRARTRWERSVRCWRCSRRCSRPYSTRAASR
jgi:acetylglutamate kinase